MDKSLILQRMKNMSNEMDKIKVDKEKEALEETNQVLQDFCIWLKGYLDKEITIEKM